MKRDLLVIPQSLKGDIIKMFHDTPTGGHLGCDKTIAKVKQRAYWYELTRDISLHVATCRECSKSKCATLHPRAPLQCFQLQSQRAQADTGRGASRIGECGSVVTLAEAEAPNIDHGESEGMEEVITSAWYRKGDSRCDRWLWGDGYDHSRFSGQHTQGDHERGWGGTRAVNCRLCCRWFRRHNPVWLGPWCRS